MIFDVARRLREAGVLGMNKRNADFIMRCNPRSSFPLVDNKLLTKQLAEKHGIPTPILYYVIEKHGDIAGMRQSVREHGEFVLKPARGSGGSGIILVRECTDAGFATQSGEVISPEIFSYHVSDILSGVFSLGGVEDLALVESLVHPDPVFGAVTYQGVPDVRIIVYRGVPVMAMVRLPTKASDGKANLHRGAIGAGIELAGGITGTAVHRSRIVTTHPDTAKPVSGIQVPYWEKMLWMASRSFEMTGLGYIGVDLVLDGDHGPLLLELNARPGLAIQLANQKGLRARLARVDQAPAAIFSNAESRVEWARKEFK